MLIRMKYSVTLTTEAGARNTGFYFHGLPAAAHRDRTDPPEQRQALASIHSHQRPVKETTTDFMKVSLTPLYVCLLILTIRDSAFWNQFSSFLPVYRICLTRKLV